MHDKLNINEKLQAIINDKFSGSADILVNLISYFLENPEDLKNEKLLDILLERFSPFQAITKFLLLSKKYSTLSGNEIKDFLLNEKETIFKEINLLFEKFYYIFEYKNNFTTISNSFFLRNFIILLHDKNPNITIFVSESRPQFEGRILAENLAANGINVKLFTEAQTPQAVEESSAILLGADKILPDGSVVNKVGSRNLAIVAQYFQIPVYVLGSKNKISDTNNFDKGIHPSDEIYQADKDVMISVTNNYFEQIERTLITAILKV